MTRLKAVCLTLYVMLCYFQAQGADKYTDENRPYEFGFTIDGEQHRHEKKDKNGIIMGEFGFITADGVYHVTVYATDENGNFKIISMKNIRVKPYPTAPDTGGRKGHSLNFSPPQQLSTPQASAKSQQAKHDSSSSIKSCSSCKIPTTTTTTTTTPRPIFATAGNSQPFSQNNKNQQAYSQYENSLTRQPLSQFNHNSAVSYPNQAINVINQEQYPQNVPGQQNYPEDEFNVGRKYLQKAQDQQSYQQNPSSESKSSVQSGVDLQYQQGLNAVQQQQQQGIIDGQYNLQPPYATRNDQQTINPSQSYPQQAGAKVQDFSAPALGQNYQTNTEHTYGSNTKSNKNYQNEIYKNEPESPSQTKTTSVQGSIPSGDRQPKTFTDILQTVNPEQQYKSIGTTPNSNASIQNKPVLIAAQMQVVDKNTNIYHKNQGENDGLPEGLTKGDMTDLLYTFNYTVGFHGHHEEGYRSGAKIGYYYVTARNGIRTRVDYVADEKGFHPRISQEVLDIQTDEVPKPESEKDEKYGLKGYEFKWLYYPVDSK